jgi:hypothetical protein
MIILLAGAAVAGAVSGILLLFSIGRMPRALR